MCVYFFDIQERKQYSEEKPVAGFNSLEPILQERSVLPCQRNNVSNGRQSTATMMSTALLLGL